MDSLDDLNEIDFNEVMQAIRPQRAFHDIDFSSLVQNMNRSLTLFKDSDVNVESPLPEEHFESIYENSQQYEIRCSEFVAMPYELLAKQMVNVDPEGLVKKKTVVEGRGKKVSDNAKTVISHYQLFRENRSEPFDSTLQHSNTRHDLENSIIPGLFIAYKSMRVGETSYFLIDPSLAFGVLGCPPRIGPNETILAEIQLNDVTETRCIESDTYFSDLLPKINLLRIDGKESFKKGNMEDCIEMYKTALSLLEDIKESNDEIARAKKSNIIIFRLNLAVVYNKVNNPEEALKECRLVLKLDSDNQKALLHCGRALIRLKKYKEAIEVLHSGRDLYPSNHSFQEELRQINQMGLQ